jgi:phosphoesterase RecJ-like protein
VVARSVYDSNNLGRLKLMGAVLSRMQLASGGRLAIMSVDQELVTASAGTYEDTEGLINLPLTVREIQAVLFLKEVGPLDWRVSMRSKGEVNINAVAREFGGGGHKNASGCSASGTLQQLTDLFTNKITDQLDKAAGA